MALADPAIGRIVEFGDGVEKISLTGESGGCTLQAGNSANTPEKTKNLFKGQFFQCAGRIVTFQIVNPQITKEVIEGGNSPHNIRCARLSREPSRFARR